RASDTRGAARGLRAGRRREGQSPRAVPGPAPGGPRTAPEVTRTRPREVPDRQPSLRRPLNARLEGQHSSLRTRKSPECCRIGARLFVGGGNGGAAGGSRGERRLVRK